MKSLDHAEPLLGGMERPSALLAPYYLFLRPVEFFKHFVDKPTPALTVLFFWFAGIVGAADNLNSRLLNDESGFADLFGSRWIIFWGMCIFLGALSGMFYSAIGGWWYAKRLGYCGVQEPDMKKVRRTYVFAHMAFAIPALVHLVLKTTEHESPMAAAMSAGVGELVVLLFLFWSVYSSFVGATTAFKTNMRRAVLWFLALPAGFYLLASGAGLFIGLYHPELMASEQQSEFRAIEHPAFSVMYPFQWQDDYSESVDGREERLVFKKPFTSARMELTLGENSSDANQCAGDFMASLENTYAVSEKQAMKSWSSHPGSGFRAMVNTGRKKLQAIVFCIPNGELMLRIYQVCPTGECLEAQAGFEAIRASFQWK